MITHTLKGTGAVMLTEEVRAFLNEKLKKIEKVVDTTDTMLRADIELGTTGGARTGDMYRAEINLSYTGGFVRAEATRETLHAAIDQAVEEARREIRRATTKHRDLMRRGAARVKDLFRYFKRRDTN